ncbi:hypothetical protein [Falsibacillus pallidus]|uniref:Uncharacterized protein n=1 Tax=Falsibacillus pallidus TaxID=493781 RepID=A0A370FXT8_9BACI|nr:hypothetical protein [Falsibacillus pallidus]RDI36431.1 hypothetical protein DFR59_1311 [Falsibacillus pallidus]
MEKQIIGMLAEIQSEMKAFQRQMNEVQSEMKEFQSELKETRADVNSIQSDLKETKSAVKKLSEDSSITQRDIKDIKQTVHRIETAQTEDVIAMLKVTSKNSESDFHYLNTRITNIDKRVFNLETRTER